MIKAGGNLLGKNWIERIADFLLGPAPHPIFVVGAAAGFGASAESEPRFGVGMKKAAHRIESPSADVALAAAGLSCYSAGRHERNWDGNG